MDVCIHMRSNSINAWCDDSLHSQAVHHKVLWHFPRTTHSTILNLSAKMNRRITSHIFMILSAHHLIQTTHGIRCTTGSLDPESLENELPINTKNNCFNGKPEFTSHDLTIALLGAAAGNCLEWFNFSLFGLMADIFGVHGRCWFTFGPDFDACIL